MWLFSGAGGLYLQPERDVSPESPAKTDLLSGCGHLPHVAASQVRGQYPSQFTHSPVLRLGFFQISKEKKQWLSVSLYRRQLFQTLRWLSGCEFKSHHGYLVAMYLESKAKLLICNTVLDSTSHIRAFWIKLSYECIYVNKKYIKNKKKPLTGL